MKMKFLIQIMNVNCIIGAVYKIFIFDNINFENLRKQAHTDFDLLPS
jgi:hypothetical protein